MSGKNNKKPAVAVNNMDALHIRLGEISEQCTDIQNVADAEQRQLTADEMTQLENLRKEFDSVEKEINVRVEASKMESRIATLNAPNRRVSQPEGAGTDGEPAPASRITGGLPVGASKSTLGFRNLGEWGRAANQMRLGKPDPRILNAPSLFGSEGVNEDGGFAVPPDFRQNILKLVMGEDSLAAMCDNQTTNSNSLSLPLDSVAPWDSTAGVQADWIGEGATITQSKPKFGAMETKTHKLGALVPVTEELLADASSLNQWLMSKVPEKFTSVMNEAIVNGDGIGKPKGILNSAAKVKVDAVAGQGNGTVKMQNVVDMWARAYGRMRQRAVWLINQDVEPQLQTMVVPGTSPAFPAYLPPGGLAGNPYATLFGRPVIPTESAAALGTEGDIILFIPDQYLFVTKGGGIRTDVSMHLYFDTDHLAFRFVIRVGGQCYWPAPLARRNGSNTLSPIVTLESDRA